MVTAEYPLPANPASVRPPRTSGHASEQPGKVAAPCEVLADPRMQRLQPGPGAQALSCLNCQCRPRRAPPSATLPGKPHDNRQLASGRYAARRCSTQRRTHRQLVPPATACRRSPSSPQAARCSDGAHSGFAQHAAGAAATFAVLIGSAWPDVAPAGAAEASTASIAGTSAAMQPAALLAASAHAAPQLIGMPACQGTAAGDSVTAARAPQSSARQPRGRLREIDPLHSGTAQVSNSGHA